MGVLSSDIIEPATLEACLAKSADEKANSAGDSRKAEAEEKAHTVSRIPWQELLLDWNFQAYVGVHLLAFAALFTTRISWRNFMLMAATYNLRMFGITGGYHRLLSHRSYRTYRPLQFLIACLGAAALQKGPLWWCSHHRHHHRHADTKKDAHSPMHLGFLWSHMGWFLATRDHVKPILGAIPDLAALREMRWLDQMHYIPPLMLAAGLWALGGWSALGWGFFVSTVACWHGTYCINSLAHVMGTRRYKCEFNTGCDARNNFVLSLVTLGEGWHNNHHCYMRSAKHGFYVWELDVTFYVLKLMAMLGLVWDLVMPPMDVLESKLEKSGTAYACRCGDEASLPEKIIYPSNSRHGKQRDAVPSMVECGRQS
eukprot:jgi/Mesvir1/26685/Mv20466-RA.1